MRVGIAADHAGYALKSILLSAFRAQNMEIVDFGPGNLNPDDDYPDFIIPLARAVRRREITKGIAICGSGVGACVAANKVQGVRAALITDCFSAHQGVEDDDMNIMCLGGLVTGEAMALELAETFLNAAFKDSERFRRRLNKVAELERLC